MMFVFFFKQKTAYEMRISDWSSDVCSSDLHLRSAPAELFRQVVELLQALVMQHQADGFGVARLALDLGPEPERRGQIGRASCRERVCQYVSISVVAVSLKKKKQTNSVNTYETLR